ncbi:MAG: MBL fold metallo-hydrolase [Actinomycetota bacterium]
MAMAVVTPALVAACSSSDGGTTPAASASAVPTTVAAPTTAPQPAATTGPTAQPSASTTEEPSPAPAEDPTATTLPETAQPEGEPLRWARANLGFVSAYVLARGNQAAIVDTGVPGSATAIGESLATLGLNYADVAHVVLTHHHQDHAGSIGEVMAQAVNATVYAGEADLSDIDQNPITGLVGGEDVFGFEMIPTPGHTAGHMCVIDHQASLLVAGDAIFGDAGGVVEGPERFFADVAESRESIKAMAELTFNTLLLGHGEPIEDRADTAVAALANSF